MWYWLCLKVLMFYDTNWIVVLIRFSTTNVLLALISKSVVGPRRIHFIKVSKRGIMRYVEKSRSNCELWFKTSFVFFLANLDNNLPSRASLTSSSYSFAVSACVSFVVSFSGLFFWLLGIKQISRRFSSTSPLICFITWWYIVRIFSILGKHLFVYLI